jgi:hypothetical protein
MRLLARLFLLVLGLAVAVPFGAVTLAAGLTADPAARDLLGALGLAGVESFMSDLLEGVPPDEATAYVTALSMGLFALLVAPPTLVALVGEILGVRSFVWYGGATGALTAGLPWIARARQTAGVSPALQAESRIMALLFLAGAVSGLGYWLVAGRSAGRRHSSPTGRPPHPPSDKRG